MNPLTNMKNVKKLSEQELRLGGKSTWHDQYKDSAWIFVGGLPYDLCEGDIICIFSQYGEIVNINLVRDKETGKPRGFCFICYEDQRSTVLAVDNFNGITLLRRIIRVDHVQDYKVPKDSKKLDDVTRQLQNEGCAPGSSFVRKRTPSPISNHSESPVRETPNDEKVKKRAKKQKKKKRKKVKKRKSNSSDESSSDEDDSEDEKKSKKKKKKSKKKSRKKSSSESERSSSDEGTKVEIKKEKNDDKFNSTFLRDEFKHVEIKREPSSREREFRGSNREHRRDESSRHDHNSSNNYRSDDRRYRDDRNRHQERYRR